MPFQGPNSPPTSDLEFILEHARDLLQELAGARIFITGGTGFFGTWLLHSLAYATDKLGLKAEVLVLSRDPDVFCSKYPMLAANDFIRFHRGGIDSFEFPEGQFSHVIHAATPTASHLYTNAPRAMFQQIIQGTSRTLEFSSLSGVEHFLFTSSGAIYGKQPHQITHLEEDFNGGPDPMNLTSAYGEAKRASEFLCRSYMHGSGIKTKIARCFAFAGPFLPLDQHFAVGNFIRDVIAGGPIRIRGDGTPRRSYLYAAELVVWLFTILQRGEPGRAYNVGSEESLSILEIATTVRNASPNPNSIEIIVERETLGGPPDRYVPSCRRANQELGLSPQINLAEAVKRTIRWLGSEKTPLP